ncbi:MAG TPA: hypothetical protein VMG82_16325 [Candidatus Sulfotelmatobacter sp.]|nr:hypothetical protein [Candidatus Sulfotelmatobacter sp.]
MLWSTNTVCKSPSGLVILLAAVLLCAAPAAPAQESQLRVPTEAIAGQAASIATTGSGPGTLYLSGPSVALKSDIQLGQNIDLTAKELQSAGRYVAVVCASTCTSAGFFVEPTKPARLTFIVHPSRAPVGVNDVISGVALPFDQFRNLVLASATVEFQLAGKNSTPSIHAVQSRDGIAWFRSNSGKSAGPLQVSASLKDLTAQRIVQQVSSDPCNLRIKGRRTTKGILVETEPVHDCAGNPVPDGTVVTFTAKSSRDVSFVDAPVKQDVARATFLASDSVVVSAASGVASGNELRIGGKE